MLMITMFRKRFHENKIVSYFANINKGRKLFLYQECVKLETTAVRIPI